MSPPAKNKNSENPKTRKKITEEQLDEYIEEIPIDEEVGFITIREMRKIIKDLIFFLCAPTTIFFTGFEYVLFSFIHICNIC